MAEKLRKWDCPVVFPTGWKLGHVSQEGSEKIKAAEQGGMVEVFKKFVLFILSNRST